MADKNPFVVFGLTEDCTQSELADAYNEQRKKYEDLRFEPGEVGADACAKLEEIEDAYACAQEILRSRFDISYTGTDLSDVDTAIKEGRLDDAQRILDDCAERTARWHYLQSAVFYRKGWVNDALRQLDFACEMEPDNTTYSEARKTMREKTQADSSTRRSFYGEEERTGRSYSDMDTASAGRGCGICDCCSTLLCADCCCECMGGDLITCC
ncbi:MAG: hypothetical protein IJ735_06495 [Clostridia bacterium]|nr:hypothetical protein [Clostridia bacterium]